MLLIDVSIGPRNDSLQHPNTLRYGQLPTRLHAPHTHTSPAPSKSTATHFTTTHEPKKPDKEENTQELTSLPNTQAIRPTTALPTRRITSHTTPTFRLLRSILKRKAAEAFTAEFGTGIHIPCRITRRRTFPITHLTPNLRAIAQRARGGGVAVAALRRPAGVRRAGWPRRRCRRTRCRRTRCWRIGAIILPYTQAVWTAAYLPRRTATRHGTAIGGR